MTDRPIFSSSPLLIPVISLMAGIVYGRLFPHFSHSVYSQHLFTLTIILLGFLAFIKKRNHAASIFIAVLFFITGTIHIGKINFPEDPENIYNLAAKPCEVTFSGFVHSLSTNNRGEGKLLVTVEKFFKEDGFQSRAHGFLQLRTAFILPEALTPGKRIVARADVARIRANTTPGVFDYRQYMADRNIFVTGKIRSPAAINIAAPDLPQGNPANLISVFFQKNRHEINGFISGLELPLSTGGIYLAILTGDRGAIPESTLESFRRSGAIHLLAISGMHMFLLFLLTTFFFNMLLKRSTFVMLRYPVWKISAAVSLLPLMYYTAISGTHPPALRAFVMTSCLILAVILDRQNSIFNSLCLAALIILTFDPSALFSPSFQLSFAAVAGMIIFNNSYSLVPAQSQSMNNSFTFIKQWAFSSLMISLVALAVTAPLTLYYFHHTSYIGPITTLLLAPVLCFFSLPLGLIASLTFQVFPSFSAFLLKTGAGGLYFAEQTTTLFSSIPYVWLEHSPPAVIQIIFYYLALLSIPVFRSSGKKWILTAVLVVLTFCAPSILNSFAKTDNRTKISFIDVGQGNATLIEFPEGKNILVDGGAIRTGSFNLGERIIAPFLWHRKILTLDAVIITHAHSDHYNGLDFVIDIFKPEHLWVNGSIADDPVYEKVLENAKSHNASVMVPEDGQVLYESGSAILRCVKNMNSFNSKSTSENSRSLVLEIIDNGRSVILPGDLMKGDGEKVIDDNTFKTQILLAPHHGSKSSATDELVRKFSPDHLVIASGSYNRKKLDKFTLPAGYNTHVHKIGVQGTTTFSISSNGIEIKTY